MREGTREIKLHKEVLYLRWNERYLRASFKTLITLLQTFLCNIFLQDFFYKRRFFARQTLLLKCINLWLRKQMQYKTRFSVIVEEALDFITNLDMVREGKMSPNFKKIAWCCFTLLNILICVIRSLNSKQFRQKLCSKYIVYSWYTLPFLINKPDTSSFFQVF